MDKEAMPPVFKNGRVLKFGACKANSITGEYRDGVLMAPHNFHRRQFRAPN